MMCETLAFWNLTSCSQLCGIVRAIFKRQSGSVKCTKTGKRLNCEVVHYGQKGNWSHWFNLIWLTCLCPSVTCYIKGQQPALCHAGKETKMYCCQPIIMRTCDVWGDNSLSEFAFFRGGSPLAAEEETYLFHCCAIVLYITAHLHAIGSVWPRRGGCIIKCNSSVRVGRPTNSVKLSPYTANAAEMSPGRGRETWSWTIPLAPTLDIRLARSHSSKDLITEWLAGGDIFLYWKLDSQKKKNAIKGCLCDSVERRYRALRFFLFLFFSFLFYCPRARLFKTPLL